MAAGLLSYPRIALNFLGDTAMASELNTPRILIFGLGVLGGDVLDFLSQSGRPYELIVATRNEEQASRRINLTRYTAANLGFLPSITFRHADVMDVERTAELIAAVKPDIIFNATTLHSWWVITQLPPQAYKRIDAARGGVWTPMHIVLARKLMQAVRQAGSDAVVVNASYPDVVNAALVAEGLAPTIGIGNIANAVPGIRLAAAHLLDRDPAAVDVRFFAHHYVSYRMPSTGSTEGAPYHLTVYLDGRALGASDIRDEDIFANVAGRFRRVKGLAGQSVTASSATAVLRAFADGGDQVVHAPGPLGLVGGYPVRIAPTGVSIALPEGLSLDQAIAINAAAQKFDGIESVDSDGTVRFTAETAGVLRETIGYDCEAMTLDDSEARAEELAAKFAEFRRQVSLDDTRAA